MSFLVHGNQGNSFEVCYWFLANLGHVLTQHIQFLDDQYVDEDVDHMYSFILTLSMVGKCWQ